MSSSIKILVIFCSLAMTYCPAFSVDTSDSLLTVFKKERQLKRQYDLRKEARIRDIKKAITSCPKNDLDALYKLNSAVWTEYNAYQRDSALTYSRRLVQIALSINDQSKLNDARIKFGQVLIPAGMFKEASDNLNGVDIHLENRQMKRKYYGIMSWLYESMANFNGDRIYSPSYLQKYQDYADSALLNIGSGPFELELAGRPAERTKANRLKNYRYHG